MLLADLRKQVGALEKDLRVRATGTGGEGTHFAAQLQAEWAKAKDARRTAASYSAWLDERVAQAAAAWVLSCVFVRFAEDNELIDWPFLTGPGERFADAEQRHEDFFRQNPHMNDRDWLIAAFDEMAAQSPAAAGLFDRQHNPLWTLTPSFEAATALLAFWRRRGPGGEIVHCFVDDDWDTRFLGDLYQDLSEYARKTYALLQTPVFVEEFILDLTLEPAVEEFGLEGLRAIDPACGSGHFLLGLFRRLLGKWQEQEPGTPQAELIRRALGSVHGCDRNPFAVAIARFRLHLAALQAARAARLKDEHGFTSQIAIGDSLWHGASEGRQEQLSLVAGDDDEGERPFTYGFEDVYEYPDLLKKNSYHVVVANPPYITPKDKAENEAYRRTFKDVCAGLYSLSIPFAALLFELALHGGGKREGAGFVGQITANSFMKREFGKKLIEDYFANKVELTHIIDTSGAYIPGHGTPTVILIGRNQIADKENPIRAVLGVRGEPGAPDDPARGLVWTAIVEQVGKPGSESEWISVEDAVRERFAAHPWSVGGGGAAELQSAIEDSRHTLGSGVARIGFVGMTHADDLMLAPSRAWARRDVEGDAIKLIGAGDDARDWVVADSESVFFPYDESKKLYTLEDRPAAGALLWPFRTTLGSRATLAGGTYFSENRPWYEWHQLPKDVGAHSWSITFAEVATHNHFVLDRGRKVFKQTAPVIKLPEGTDEDDHLALLGVLNSSTACFFLRAVCFPKGGDPVGREGARVSVEKWSERYAFNASNVEKVPLPAKLPLAFGRELDSLAQQLATQEPSAVCDAVTPSRNALDAARSAWRQIRGRMIAVQEELDWTVYGSYHLLSARELAATTAPKLDELPELNLGERAFEIVLARKVAAGKAETQWFARHNFAPITEVPAHWSGRYRAIIDARIDLITSRKDLALIERPECKRRWAISPWEKREADAVRTWLLDRAENPDLWYVMRDGYRQPRTLTVNQLADRLRRDPDVVSVAALYARDHLGKPDLPLERVLEQILATEYVPYLARLRYKESGLRKRDEWEAVWDQQREEDRTGKRLAITPPPKYASADFLKTSYWSHRGKLDVPKERFIGYPGASPNADSSILLGWAGWDHKDQAQALVNLVNDRATDAAWAADRLAPLLDGLAELLPWLRQWHGTHDADWEGVPADDFSAFLTEQRAKLGVGQ